MSQCTKLSSPVLHAEFADRVYANVPIQPEGIPSHRLLDKSFLRFAADVESNVQFARIAGSELLMRIERAKQTGEVYNNETYFVMRVQRYIHMLRSLYPENFLQRSKSIADQNVQDSETPVRQRFQVISAVLHAKGFIVVYVNQRTKLPYLLHFERPQSILVFVGVQHQ